jgi:hypothetical protein
MPCLPFFSHSSQALPLFYQSLGGIIAGFGVHAYVLGLEALLRVLAETGANR